ncbi:MAG: addiction module antitoxin [Parcubacteria group bacterium GW2011_GWC1_36_9]|uniref:Addiction module toxin, RelE/StbE family n=1 Tax=Candidatus Yanofskybacteria bacterium GW2011_GWC2_37_9 TaxID=1619028 RepID=A0A0G0I4F5_9BACT|nr:MAG: addiction module antitoxin [Parcubacteria group bacterium GW2011_GWC1_36_9]KKQ45845.1 MAG: Addiction module toxin, RelE/StbE family [Candidatus Yanofskybacteria bacterium GW2011_GWC2_37_9]
MRYLITEEGLKTFKLLPKSIQKRILNKLDFIFENDNPLNFAKKLNYFEYGEYRMRIGDYRASFDVKKNVAYFLKFGHRKDIYK